MSYPGRAPHVLAWLQHAAGVAKLVALVLWLWDVWAPQVGAPGALCSPEMLIRYGVEAARRGLSVSEGSSTRTLTSSFELESDRSCSLILTLHLPPNLPRRSKPQATYC